MNSFHRSCFTQKHRLCLSVHNSERMLRVGEETWTENDERRWNNELENNKLLRYDDISTLSCFSRVISAPWHNQSTQVQFIHDTITHVFTGHSSTDPYIYSHSRPNTMWSDNNGVVCLRVLHLNQSSKCFSFLRCKLLHTSHHWAVCHQKEQHGQLEIQSYSGHENIPVHC